MESLLKSHISINPFLDDKALFKLQDSQSFDHPLGDWLQVDHFYLKFDRWSESSHSLPEVIKGSGGWISIKNLPLHYWKNQVFEAIGFYLGGLIKISANTLNFTDLSQAVIQVARNRCGFLPASIPIYGNMPFALKFGDITPLSNPPSNHLHSFPRQLHIQDFSNPIDLLRISPVLRINPPLHIDRSLAILPIPGSLPPLVTCRKNSSAPSIAALLTTVHQSGQGPDVDSPSIRQFQEPAAKPVNPASESAPVSLITPPAPSDSQPPSSLLANVPSSATQTGDPSNSQSVHNTHAALTDFGPQPDALTPSIPTASPVQKSLCQPAEIPWPLAHTTQQSHLKVYSRRKKNAKRPLLRDVPHTIPSSPKSPESPVRPASFIKVGKNRSIAVLPMPGKCLNFDQTHMASSFLFQNNRSPASDSSISLSSEESDFNTVSPSPLKNSSSPVQSPNLAVLFSSPSLPKQDQNTVVIGKPCTRDQIPDQFSSLIDLCGLKLRLLSPISSSD